MRHIAILATTVLLAGCAAPAGTPEKLDHTDRKSTRLNSSHWE